MAELHDLSPPKGSTRNRKRVGRGPGSGTGKTAGRGQKGQKARSGGNIHPRFEGGQMPLIRRIPKRGFKSVNRTDYQIVNLRELVKVDGDVSPESLRDAGLIGSGKKPVKILGVGEVEGRISATAHAFSASAREKIEAAGGSVTVIGDATGEAEAAEADAPDDSASAEASDDADEEDAGEEEEEDHEEE